MSNNIMTDNYGYFMDSFCYFLDDISFYYFKNSERRKERERKRTMYLSVYIKIIYFYL